MDDKGTAMFWVIVEQPAKWKTAGMNFNTLNAGLPSGDILSVDIEKSTDRKTLNVEVSGLSPQALSFSATLPELRAVPERVGVKGFNLAVTWNKPTVKLFFNGKQVAEQQTQVH